MAKAILKGVKIVKVDEIIIPDESDIDEKMFLENLNTLPLPKPKHDNSLPVFDDSGLIELNENHLHPLDGNIDDDGDDEGMPVCPNGEVVLVDEDYIINQVRLALRNGDRVSITKREDSEDDN